jgi:hypothetical protein
VPQVQLELLGQQVLLVVDTLGKQTHQQLQVDLLALSSD